MREKIGIVIDYSVRIPDFISCYKQLKEQVTVGSLQTAAGSRLDANALDESKKSFWDELRDTNMAAVEFYERVPIPTANQGEDFDITYRKYFYNVEHRNKFLEDWSYNMFGQGSVTNKQDITLINIAQNKLFDIVLIDRCTHTRKVGNTFAFLARAGLFIKEIIFVTNDAEIEAMQKDYLDIWNPYQESKQVILPPTQYGKPTQEFLDWLMEAEKKIKK